MIQVSVNVFEMGEQTFLVERRFTHFEDMRWKHLDLHKGCPPEIKGAEFPDRQLVTMLNMTPWVLDYRLEKFNAYFQLMLKSDNRDIRDSLYDFLSIDNWISDNVFTNYLDHFGCTKLMHAAVNNEVKHTQKLLKLGADPNIVSTLRGDVEYEDCTALILACEKNFTECALLLIAEPKTDVNNKNKAGMNALMKACDNGNMDIIKALLKREGIKLDEKDKIGRNAMLYAARCGSLDAVKALVAAKADVNVLVDDANSKGYTVLMKAIEYGNSEIAVELTNAGTKVDIQGSNTRKTALILAATFGDMDALLAILLKLPDLNMQDNDGYSALMHATERGEKDIVLALMERNSTISLKDSSGQDAIKIATTNKFEEIKGLLEGSGKA
jgi:serine/threonine-protein phosphatase 6 regulatory ankyrin repeat subunit B